MNLDQAIASARSHLLSLRNASGWWEGHLSSSALSTATAIVALHSVDAAGHQPPISAGAGWLVANQNADGGWGDTTASKSNLSTTLLCWSALRLAGDRALSSAAIDRASAWIRAAVGSLKPAAIASAVIARYGKDKTFSVPILMHCAICGTMGDAAEAWRRVLPLPFELAALPRGWFGAIGLPVVSYALPALIAIGHARFHHAPPSWWNPLRWLRSLLWERISPMLAALQPSSGGYLEATPLTSFVTMALAAAGEKNHPCVPLAVEFLLRSQRPDGSWPIDTNLATWGTTLAVKALVQDESSMSRQEAGAPLEWLLSQQYKSAHPFTNAAPGGWAWTDLPGGVPDADDTSGALIALDRLCRSPSDRGRALPAVIAGITWLLGLQNRDGGIPTFCRGWGALPFDRSTPEITAHAMWAWSIWLDEVPPSLRDRIRKAARRASRYLLRSSLGWSEPLASRPGASDGITHVTDGIPPDRWMPLWFGNEHTSGETNPVFGTAAVALALSKARHFSGERQNNLMSKRAAQWLWGCQKPDGSWGGDAASPSSIEETALALAALASCSASLPANALPRGIQMRQAEMKRAVEWLLEHTRNGTHFPPSPIGLYFARLWYHERLYPVVWTLQALQLAKEAGIDQE